MSPSVKLVTISDFQFKITLQTITNQLFTTKSYLACWSSIFVKRNSGCVCLSRSDTVDLRHSTSLLPPLEPGSSVLEATCTRFHVTNLIETWIINTQHSRCIELYHTEICIIIVATFMWHITCCNVWNCTLGEIRSASNSFQICHL